MHRLIGIVLLLALGAACSSDRDDPESAEASADAGLIEPQRQALERARAVEADVAEAARAQQEALEKLETMDRSDSGDGRG